MQAALNCARQPLSPWSAYSTIALRRQPGKVVLCPGTRWTAKGDGSGAGPPTGDHIRSDAHGHRHPRLRDLVVRRCNPTWAAFVARYTPTPAARVVPGARFIDLAPGCEETTLARYKRALAGEVVREDGVPMHSDGIISYWDVVITPLLSDGKIVGLLDVTIAATERQQALAEVQEHRDSLERIVHDRTAALSEANAQLRQEVDERASAEAALRTSEEKYRELVENANSIILRMDTSGRVTFFNEYAQRFFGFDESEILGRSVVGTIVPHVDTTGADLAG